MKFSTLMIIKAAICLGFGVPIMFTPGFVYSYFLGLSLDSAGEFAAREYGAGMLGILLICWFARNIPESTARWAITLGLFVYDLLGLIVTLAGQLGGQFSFMGWSVVLIYLFLAVGFGYFLFRSPMPAAHPQAA